ncbi:MAG: hypothetical protein E5299_00494 [Burkholderia gladioli]|nr:MAG: hypothetical protein E5299_00494 [Burkholderia gladioli]
MASTGIISGDTNGLRTSEVRMRLMMSTRTATSVACASMRRAQRQLPVRVLNRYIAFSASDRRW